MILIFRLLVWISIFYDNSNIASINILKWALGSWVVMRLKNSLLDKSETHYRRGATAGHKVPVDDWVNVL